MAAFHWFSLFLILSTTIFVNAGRSKRSPILTDDLAGPGEFPYAVAIVESAEAEYICSGGIIGERYILSAAHCFLNNRKKLLSDTYAVYAGTLNVKSALREQNSVVLRVKKIFAPRDYKYSIKRSDIAILELVLPLAIERNNLQKLTLPSGSRNVASGERAVVAAFGACNASLDDNGIAFGEGYGKLRYANINIVKKAECHGMESETVSRAHLLGLMTKNGTAKYGLCYGDSGSSLVQHSSIVIGVMTHSYDTLCDGKVLPSLFTKVSSYLPFIQHVISGGNGTRDIIVNKCRIGNEDAAESSAN